MHTKTRWELAQEYEHNWWNSRQNIGISNEYYNHAADEIRDFLQNKITVATRILEIGCGPLSIVNALHESNERYGIDPLEDFYATISSFTQLRDKNVHYLKAKGEELPFENHSFDIVIIDNVLDHCDNPDRVLSEMNRVLAKNGYIYFRQNTYNRYAKFIRKLMEFFLIDKGHPYTFGDKELKKKLSKYQLEIKKEEKMGSYWSNWINDLFSKTGKAKIKALLFVTRIKIVYHICRI